MENLKLVGKADLEKLNASELNSVKGGVTDEGPVKDSQHHDSNNNDTFEDTEGEV